MDTDSGMRVLCDAIGIGSDNFNLPLPTTPLNQHQQSQQQPPLPASAGSQPPQSGPSHQCRICNRIYERADHLNRHLKSHENARPFKCDQCTKSFNRADLLSRHRGSHDRQSNGSTRIERADRASAACLACVSAKAKCQDQKPCARCVKKGISCEMSSNNTQSNSPASSRNDGPQLEMASAHQQATSITQPKIGMSGALSNGKATQHIAGMFDNNLASTTAFQQSLNYDHSMNPPQSEAQNSGSSYYNGVNLLPVTTEPYFDDSFNNFTFVTGNGAPNFPQDMTFGDQDLDFSLWDIDLDSVELAYQITDSSTPEDHGNQDQKPSNRRAKDVSRRRAAFERSPWLYKPTPSDHALTDQADLNVDEDNIPSALTPSSPEANLAEFASCCITSKTRDQMLSLLFTMQRKDPSQVPSFPSLAMLNNIIQVFFVQDKYRVDNLIHTGTFEPSQTIPQLLNAIVAAGSTSISIPAIWKMGLALQEVVRHTVADVWEQNNSKIRNVETLQAFMLCLDIGLWSGFKRRMEIAESFAQPPVIMLRRGGYFGAHRSYSTAIPDIHDSGAILESKWKKWAEAESYKRLIIHLFIHDIHASIAMQKPPLIYFTELKFPLPCPRDLWRASTAIEWRNLYHSKIPPCTDIPNFMDAMQNIDILEAVSDHVDLHLCTLTILHGFWAQIWAYDQSKLFYPESKSAHRLSLLTEHRELYRDVSEFSTKIPHLTRNSPDAVLIAELFMLILHAPPDELQRFAGKYGEDEAKQATAVFKNWSRSPNSRTAVWHAGQVLRAARRLTSARLRGFNAIAVYYASLTLWVYGLMMQSRSPSLSQKSTTSSTTKKSTTQVRLNEAETAATRIFLSTDDGIPGLAITSNYDRQESAFVPLEATDRVLRVARDIYRSNFPVLDEPLPPLVENLGNLLRDLSSVPGSRVSRAGTEPREGPG